MTNNKHAMAKSDTETGSKAQILRHARHLFATHGFDGVSVRDIVTAAGVNVSLVSYYFGGKEGLYRACLETLAESEVVRVLSDLPPPQNAAEFRHGVSTIAVAFLSTVQTDPDGQLIAARELSSATPIFEELLDTVYRKPTHMVEGYIASAQSNGLIKRSLKPDMLASALCAMLTAQTYFDALRERCLGTTLKNPAFLSDFVSHVTEFFCSGVLV